MNAKFRLVFCCAALFTLSIGNLKADLIGYTSLSDGSFGTVDLNTGAFSSLGNTDGVAFPGLGALNGTLYGTLYETFTGNLYRINPSNGTLTTVGDGATDYECFGSTTSGLYALGYGGGAYGTLYSINPANGAATSIGPTGLTVGAGPTAGDWFGLSTGSSTLYFSNLGNLYTINTSTGAATEVGSIGTQVAAMVWEGGVLYGAAGTQIDTLNTTTGAATAGPNLSGTSGQSIFGLAPDPLPSSPTAPEPGTTALFAVGAAALGLVRRGRAR
ncbi:MAG: PEP-CTERM sorting domain-containing protein [Bryobacteraceae bacterium]